MRASILQVFIAVTIQFSAQGTYCILRAEGRALIGDRSLIRDGTLILFLTLTTKCVNERGLLRLKELCPHVDITVVLYDVSCSEGR